MRRREKASLGRRLRGAAFFCVPALAAFGVAAAVELADGSSNFAWFVTALGAGLLLVGIMEAFGLEQWIRRASPVARVAYLAVSFTFLGAAVAAYLIWQTVALWWLAPVAAWPLYWLLILEREEAAGGADDDYSGPLTPPDGADGGV